MLYAENVRLQNAPWGSRPDMLTAKRVEVEIALLPLLARRVRIEGLEVIEPDLVLEVDRNGNGNWQFAADGAKPAERSEVDGGLSQCRQRTRAAPRRRAPGHRGLGRNDRARWRRDARRRAARHRCQVAGAGRCFRCERVRGDGERPGIAAACARDLAARARV